MTNSRLKRTLMPFLVVLAMALSACGSGVARMTDSATTAFKEMGATAEPAAAHAAGPVVPVSYTAQAPIDLESDLIELYRSANPSVVFIIVPNAGSGTGFVYSDDGYIVTNHHVVSGGSRYEIVFANGEREWASLVGSDTDSDLAVLKVERLPEEVGPLPLADGTSLSVGQFVVAIGNPFGEVGSMSLGIVSALGRSLPSQRAQANTSTYSLPQVIQTDAAINPGNSGGPLLNLAGEVVGINFAIASTSGTSSGVGYSIPVAAVHQVVPDLIAEGEHDYSYMGASFDNEVSLEEQELYGVTQTQGAYVVGVTTGSPAAQAGLAGADPQTGQGGDLVVAVDGQPVGTFADLNSYLVFYTDPGQTVELTVLRGSSSEVLSLTLGERP